MSDWHFGDDYDMWLYPPVDWTAPDYDYELPEPIEAANIDGTMMVNAEDAIEQVRRLQAENAKLKQELEAVGTAAYLYGRNDLKAENAKLREESSKYHDLYVHAIADAEVWHLQWSAEHQENAKLRELARRFGEYVSQDRCEGCVMKRRCNNGDVEDCWQLTEIRALANELGVKEIT